MGGRKWSLEEERFLVEHYHDADLDFMQRELCRNKETIKKKANSLGLYRDSKWLPEHDEFIRNNYKNCMNLELSELITAEFGIERSEIAVTRRVSYLGLTNTSEERRRNRGLKYKYDYTYFDVIDTEEKAYWAGFIFGDGSICDGKVSLNLAETDISHLRLLNKCINGNIPVKVRTQPESYYRPWNQHFKERTIARFVISSRHMVESLKTLNMTERNTYNLCKMPNIPDELKRHWIRGLFDADGSVSGGPIPVCCGLNHVLFDDIRAFLYKNGIVSYIRADERYETVSYRLEVPYSHRDKIYDFLYKDSNIFLNRKQVKFYNMKSTCDLQE